jgi:hypothetical protein
VLVLEVQIPQVQIPEAQILEAQILEVLVASLAPLPEAPAGTAQVAGAVGAPKRGLIVWAEVQAAQAVPAFLRLLAPKRMFAPLVSPRQRPSCVA